MGDLGDDAEKTFGWVRRVADPETYRPVKDAADKAVGTVKKYASDAEKRVRDGFGMDRKKGNTDGKK